MGGAASGQKFEANQVSSTPFPGRPHVAHPESRVMFGRTGAHAESDHRLDGQHTRRLDQRASRSDVDDAHRLGRRDRSPESSHDFKPWLFPPIAHAAIRPAPLGQSRRVQTEDRVGPYVQRPPTCSNEFASRDPVRSKNVQTFKTLGK